MLTRLPIAVADLRTVDELSNGKVDLTYGRHVHIIVLLFYVISYDILNS